jgi:signal transduction histidine kinase
MSSESFRRPPAGVPDASATASPAEDALDFGGRLMDAVERERRAIARELQEGIGQELAALAMELQQLGAGGSAGLQAQSEELFNRTVSISDTVQALSRRLYSWKLEYLGVVPAMRGLCAEFARQQQATVDFVSIAVPLPLPDDVSLCLFRVLQEALRNAVKYSGAHHVEAQLLGSSASVLLTIRDRGRGFDPETAMQGHGLGLLSMRQRARHLKGTMSITSKPGWGTEITLRLPIPATRHGGARKESRRAAASEAAGNAGIAGIAGINDRDDQPAVAPWPARAANT